MHIRKEDGSLSENNNRPESGTETPKDGTADKAAESHNVKKSVSANGQRHSPHNGSKRSGPSHSDGSGHGHHHHSGKHSSGSSGSSSEHRKRTSQSGSKHSSSDRTSSSHSKEQLKRKRSETAAAEKPAKKKRFSKKQALTVAALILILLLILALVVVIILWHYFGLFDRSHKDRTTSEAITYSDVDYSRADTTDKVTEDQKLKELTAQAEKISNKDVMNILLIGEDLRDTAEKSAGNTDVMMLISVNTKDKTITQTSIMRDCYVGFEDENGWWWYSRINAAYWYGGVKLTRSTIENYLNVKIDRYVLVNFNVFIDIVDALGGLDLYVTDEEANGYPDADPNGENTRGMQNPLDEQNKYLHNKKGTDYIPHGGNLHLNGNQSLAYARLRYVGNSDWERTQRQRKVISEMIKKSRSMSLVDMDRLANKIFPQIKTDVTSGEMAQLLIDMLDYRNYTIQELRVPADDTYTNQIIDGMDVLSVDFPTNAQMFKELVYGSIELEDKTSSEKKNIE